MTGPSADPNAGSPPGRKLPQFLVYLGVFLLQFIMTQVATLAASFLLPGMENYGTTRPVVFATLLVLTFTAGSFLTGWLAIRSGWLRAAPKYPARLGLVLLGAALPLAVALVLYRKLEPGNPFFMLAIWGSVLGFHLPGGMESRPDTAP